jgi:hypothetical protein
LGTDARATTPGTTEKEVGGDEPPIRFRGDEPELFLEFNHELIRKVRSAVRADPADIEDACSFAWVQFFRYQPYRDREWRGWLFRTAQREAWRLNAQHFDERPMLYDTDVYGVDPERVPADPRDAYEERLGTKDAIRRVWTLWAECDGQDAVRAVHAFDPKPSVIIGSGSDSNCHAYWPLTEPLSAPAAEAANLRLAVALGADVACFDASRILRPPGTWNYKRRPPTPVVALRMEPGRRFSPEEVVRNAPAVDDDRIAHRWRAQTVRTRPGDPLLGIPPSVYVSNLVGRAPGRNHKVACPFHEDQRPSLHVYPTAERGWCCFSCGRGGSIYDLAAALWGVTPRGREFVRLRQELLRRFAQELERPVPARGLGRA